MVKRIALSGKHGRGKYALVDDADYQWLSRWSWYVTDMGYAAHAVFDASKKQRTGMGARVEFMHRAILGLTPGDGVVADHQNRDKLDNRRSNLRAADYAGNARNRRPGGEIPLLGVVRARNYFEARITVGGTHRGIGVFDTAQDAARAYDYVARRLFGEFANLNFPDDAPFMPDRRNKHKRTYAQIIAIRRAMLEQPRSWRALGRDFGMKGDAAKRLCEMSVEELEAIKAREDEWR